MQFKKSSKEAKKEKTKPTKLFDRMKERVNYFIPAIIVGALTIAVWESGILQANVANRNTLTLVNGKKITGGLLWSTIPRHKVHYNLFELLNSSDFQKFSRQIGRGEVKEVNRKVNEDLYIYYLMKSKDGRVIGIVTHSPNMWNIIGITRPLNTKTCGDLENCFKEVLTDDNKVEVITIEEYYNPLKVEKRGNSLILIDERSYVEYRKTGTDGVNAIAIVPEKNAIKIYHLKGKSRKDVEKREIATLDGDSEELRSREIMGFMKGLFGIKGGSR